MKANEGTVDRAVRIIGGVGILSLAFFGPQSPWGFVGLIPIFTGVVGICPLYSILGFNTCRASERPTR
jgi:hypothetical protein